MQRNLDKLITNHSSSSNGELIDQSFFNLNIPSARRLYKEVIERDKFILITPLTLPHIQAEIYAKGYKIKIENYFLQIVSKTLPNSTLNVYTFHLRKFPGKDEFLFRRKILAELKRLRYEFLPPGEITLDADTPLSLHFSGSESYTFQNHRVSNIPLEYRALCIYDLIVDKLYHALFAKGDAFKDHLIADFLMIHNDKEIKDQYRANEEHHYKVKFIAKIISQFKYTTCDRKTAKLLNHALKECFDPEENNVIKNELSNIPLTRDAYDDHDYGERKTHPFHGMAKQSHYYCSLIQYRYLLDLKALAFPDKLELDRQRVKSHMEKWGDYKNQPNIMKLQCLMARIDAMEIERNVIDHKKWDTCYWEEYKNIKGEWNIRFMALAFQFKSRLFTQSFAIKLQDLFTEISNGMVVAYRGNVYSKNSDEYEQGYYIFIKPDDLQKLSIDSILARNGHVVAALKNGSLTRIMLTDQGFFQAKSPQGWCEFLKIYKKYDDDLKIFIFNLAMWSTMKDWFVMQNKHQTRLPVELWLYILHCYNNLQEKECSSGLNRKL